MTIHTPWGVAQTVTQVADGIVFYETASHGGYHVAADLLPAIDPRGRAYAAKWSGSEQWFEEDCAWSAIAIAFPVLFDSMAINTAYAIAHRYWR